MKVGFLASAVFFSLVSLAEAAPPFAGQWDMSLDNTNRQCRVTLREDAVAGGKALAMPMGCRRAMPILSDAMSWQDTPDKLTFADAAGKPVLNFSWANDHTLLVAKGPDGDAYTLRLAGTATHAPGFEPMSSKPVVLDPPVVPPSPTIAGRYALIRDPKKPSNCTLVLDMAKPVNSAYKASLENGCSDQGMKIFDPVSWRLENGRLTLTAKRGHQTALIAQPDGSFSKDGNLTSGAPLILKKQ